METTAPSSRCAAGERTPMALVSIENRAAVRIITYANAPFGTMAAAGTAEMFHAAAAD
ncbi:hypothetical protein ACVIGA_005497 [Bradyrhizobium sp. USDA 3240]